MEYLILIIQTTLILFVLSLSYFLISELLPLPFFTLKNKNTTKIKHAENIHKNNSIHNESLSTSLNHTYGLASFKIISIGQRKLKNLFKKNITIYSFSSQSRPHGIDGWK